jgi:class 3 adenylate cyclase
MLNVDSFPRGTVTFVFTDIEGSTRLLHDLGRGYADALAEHRRLLRSVFARNHGVEVDTQGDAFFVAFPSARDALAAAREGQAALTEGPIRVSAEAPARSRNTTITRPEPDQFRLRRSGGPGSG